MDSGLEWKPREEERHLPEEERKDAPDFLPKCNGQIFKFKK